MPGIDDCTAVRTERTKGGDPQRRLWRLQQDPLLETFFFFLSPKQRKWLFKFLLMGLGWSAVQHPLGKAKRAGGGLVTATATAARWWPAMRKAGRGKVAPVRSRFLGWSVPRPPWLLWKAGFWCLLSTEVSLGIFLVLFLSLDFFSLEWSNTEGLAPPSHSLHPSCASGV